MTGCHYCGTTRDELRPYGPGGSSACFACAMATPERRNQTDAVYGAMLDAAEAAGSGVVVLGANGPDPATPGFARTITDLLGTGDDR